MESVGSSWENLSIYQELKGLIPVVAGVKGAKQILQEIVILPALRPEVSFLGETHEKFRYL